jgi:uncharacterized protein YukE
MTLRVVIEDLVASAIAVTGHGEDLAAAHSAADGRVVDAQSGWQGRSAEALGALSVRWAEDGRALVARLSDHAQGLLAGSLQFVQQDQDSADALDSVL